jgi:predicted transglutaminase-like cysteine proteinase
LADNLRPQEGLIWSVSDTVERIFMSRHGLLLILIIGLVGSIAVPMSHADYRKLFKAPDDYITKTQYPEIRERTRREYDLGYDKHPSPRVRAWYSDVMSISGADQAKQLQQIFAVTNARIEYREERAEVWSTPGERISRGYGDCDDFVAAYLTAAVILGFKKDGL